MKELIISSNKNIEVKEFNGQRVLTFKDIDFVHDRVEGTASRNFRENKEHFIPEEDFYFITGYALKEFKQTTNFVGSNASELILITESGYLMLVKSFTDELAWKVQRDLVKSYFRKNNIPKLSKELQAIFVIDERTEKLTERMDKFENESPLFNIECDELQKLVRKIGVKLLGGKDAPAYKNNSLRQRVYSDIQKQLNREFGTSSYKAIKRIQLDKSKEIIESYKLPLILQDEITVYNNQLSMGV